MSTEQYGTLIVQRPNADDLEVALDLQPLTIGRLPDNRLVLSASVVSGRHAEIVLTPQGPERRLVPQITDVGSRFGTFVDGEQIRPQEPTLLAPGARVEIGPFVLIYVPADVEPPDVVADPEDTPAQVSPAEEVPEESLERPAAQPTRVAEAVVALPAAPLGAPRDRLPVPVAPGQVSRYLRDLPIVFHGSDFLARYLQIFETIWEPLEQRQDQIQMYFDPRTCPESFIGWLAGWLGLEIDPHWPEERRRRLLAEAFDLYRWRGTRYGLERLIEVCTGMLAEVSEGAAAGLPPYVFRVRVHGAASDAASRALVEDLVRTHKPAHAGYILEWI